MMTVNDLVRWGVFTAHRHRGAIVVRPAVVGRPDLRNVLRILLLNVLLARFKSEAQRRHVKRVLES